MKRHCCYITDDLPEPKECELTAEWTIVHGASPDDVTEACSDHVGVLLTDAPEHRIYPIEKAQTEPKEPLADAL